MILQAHEYEELEGTPGRLQEFFDSTNGEFILSFPFTSILYKKKRTILLLVLQDVCFSLDLLHVFCSVSGCFRHPDVLQLLGSLSELRESHMTKMENSASTETEGASSSLPTAAPWRHSSWADSSQAPRGQRCWIVKRYRRRYRKGGVLSKGSDETLMRRCRDAGVQPAARTVGLSDLPRVERSKKKQKNTTTKRNRARGVVRYQGPQWHHKELTSRACVAS